MAPPAEPTKSPVQDSSSDGMYPPAASLAPTVTLVPNTRVLTSATMTTSTTTKMMITFEDQIEALKQYRERKGHTNVSYSDNKSLARFCFDVRYAKKNPSSKKGKV